MTFLMKEKFFVLLIALLREHNSEITQDIVRTFAICISRGTFFGGSRLELTRNRFSPFTPL